MFAPMGQVLAAVNPLTQVNSKIQAGKNAAAKAAKSVLQSTVASVQPATTLATGYFASAFGSDLMTRSIFQYIFATAVISFIIFLILALIHSTIYPVFSFSPNDFGFIPVPTISDKQSDFVGGVATYNTGASKIKGLTDANYTIGVDLYLTGAFSTTQAPRVLLYRTAASGPVEQAVTDTATVTSDPETGIVDTSNFGVTYPDTNLIVWLDPIKNDLYASVKTGTTFQHSAPVQNVPIKNVFALTVVFSDQFLEIYINAKLEQSMAITQQVAGAGPNTILYGPTQTAQSTAKIANLSVWPRVLTAREVRSYESSPTATNKLF